MLSKSVDATIGAAFGQVLRVFETTLQMTAYDRTGTGYSVTRRPDPRFAAVIGEALRDMTSVANIGAGTDAYEPPQTLVAVDPSRVMLNQRTRDRGACGAGRC
jgi:hypothetical protein